MSILQNGLFLIYFISLISSNILGQYSGGYLIPQQAAYDVKYYDLDLNIDTENRYISGSLLARCKILKNIDSLVFDLDDSYIIDSILFKDENEVFTLVSFRHSDGRIYIPIPSFVIIDNEISVKIFYEGNALQVGIWWTQGFDWMTTPNGKPWIGVKCEQSGADIWWPCKDHPSDEPDSMSLHFTVPEPLTCVSNGKLVGMNNNIDGTTTSNWFVSSPINNYCVSLYIAEYSLIEDKYYSTSGDSIPFYFWIMPEDYENAVDQLPVFLKEFQFLESICGPFPFARDKLGFAQSFYQGAPDAMEHQTIISYHGFSVDDQWGYDYIHLHELAHEWWGNFVTAKDWSDIWIHEGLATYMQSLYVEHLSGRNAYYSHIQQRFRDDYYIPLAPRNPMYSDAISILHPYGRGATVLHTLRFHLGDENFFSVIKHWAYPDTADIDNKNGRLCRLVNTDDMKEIAEKVSGVELDPFFEVFFREASLPHLKIERYDSAAHFTWITETNVPLDLDVEVKLNNIDRSLEMTAGQGSMNVLETDELIIDPNKWILMSDPIITNIDRESSTYIPTEYSLEQNYPNPFNPVTTIKYSIPTDLRYEYQDVRLVVYDILGREVATVVNEKQRPGNYEVEFSANGGSGSAGDGFTLSSGIYFYRLKAGDYVETKKMILLK